MNNKETAIELLEAVAHWMKTSEFEYTMRDLTDILDEVADEYNQHLKNTA